MLRRLPAYLRLAWRLAREPLLSRTRRAAVIGAAGYLASPVDLMPGLIPVIGQLDDLAVAIAAIRFALAGLSAERRRQHLDAVGLAEAELSADLWTVGATSGWVLRAGARTMERAARAGGRVAMTGVGLAARASTALAKRGTGAAQAASTVAHKRLARSRGRDRSQETLLVEREGDPPGADG